MHTRVDIAFVSTIEENTLVDVARKIQCRIAEIEHIANCFDPDSELSRFNAGIISRDALSTELSYILNLCDDWKRRTDGIFDVAYSGSINLSGFIKGYALDEVRSIIESASITNALVNLGNSSILALGSKSESAKGWKITNTSGETFTLCDECLTTSGNDTPTRRHIVNPLTGQLIEGQRIVSVVTPTGAEGEVMATVKFIKETK